MIITWTWKIADNDLNYQIDCAKIRTKYNRINWTIFYMRVFLSLPNDWTKNSWENENWNPKNFSGLYHLITDYL